MPIFHNLTLGYEVRDSEGHWRARCVDDLTLQHDLQKSAAPRPGWYRIVSDDVRLLRLIESQSDPEASIDKVLEPVATLFQTELVSGPGGMKKVVDRAGASVAMACSLPGERERPLELITPPWESDQRSRLQEMLSLLEQEACGVPHEGATHIHFDGSLLRQASTVANLVNLWSHHGDALRARWGTNPHCTRLGKWPQELRSEVNSSGFLELDWAQARERLAALPLTKYCDLNLLNLITERPHCTVELRVLPSGLRAGPIIEAAEEFVGLLERARLAGPVQGKS